MTGRLDVDEVLDAVVDDGAVEPWDDDLVSRDLLVFTDTRSYADRLTHAAESAGGTEAGSVN